MTTMTRMSILLLSGLPALLMTCRPIVEGEAPLPVVTGTLDDVFKLREGQTAEFREPGISLTFLARVVDSRCPVRQQCSVPGRVIVRFLLADSSRTVPFSVDGFLSNTAEDVLTTDIEVFHLEVVTVEPYPQSAGDAEFPASVSAILTRP